MADREPSGLLFTEERCRRDLPALSLCCASSGIAARRPPYGCLPAATANRAGRRLAVSRAAAIVDVSLIDGGMGGDHSGRVGR